MKDHDRQRMRIWDWRIRFNGLTGMCLWMILIGVLQTRLPRRRLWGPWDRLEEGFCWYNIYDFVPPLSDVKMLALFFLSHRHHRLVCS
ncbi:hypothetical protein QBC41DRAFT_330560, partial [Cercophora samala]